MIRWVTDGLSGTDCVIHMRIRLEKRLDIRHLPLHPAPLLRPLLLGPAKLGSEPLDFFHRRGPDIAVLTQLVQPRLRILEHGNRLPYLVARGMFPGFDRKPLAAPDLGQAPFFSKVGHQPGLELIINVQAFQRGRSVLERLQQVPGGRVERGDFDVQFGDQAGRRVAPGQGQGRRVEGGVYVERREELFDPDGVGVRERKPCLARASVSALFTFGNNDTGLDSHRERALNIPTKLGRHPRPAAALAQPEPGPSVHRRIRNPRFPGRQDAQRDILEYAGRTAEHVCALRESIDLALIVRRRGDPPAFPCACACPCRGGEGVTYRPVREVGERERVRGQAHHEFRAERGKAAQRGGSDADAGRRRGDG